jgi:hypothetical protein
MKNRQLATWILLLVAATVVSAQGSKTIKEKKITIKTVHEYFIEEGYDEPVVELIETYNEVGDILELKEFNKVGEVKRWEKYVYDEDGEVVEEIFLDEKGKVTLTEKNIYADGLRIEKHYLNPKGKMIKKKVYSYEHRQ